MQQRLCVSGIQERPWPQGACHSRGEIDGNGHSVDLITVYRSLHHSTNGIETLLPTKLKTNVTGILSKQACTTTTIFRHVFEMPRKGRQLSSDLLTTVFPSLSNEMPMVTYRPMQTLINAMAALRSLNLMENWLRCTTTQQPLSFPISLGVLPVHRFRN